ncbi:MAG: hypothetical protein JST44_00235 [Cyanobacteria bacterium SZAS LIN-5]|nr:hypothetical protein [Cyanobacteria bacterium SZAS LIN-5]
MFKKRLLRFLRKFWKPEQPLAAPEPVEDLQTRLQHLSERYPSAEPPADAVHVQMHEIELCEVDLATEQGLTRGIETTGLNNWANNRRKTSSNDNLSVPKSPFAYDIDPGRAPAKRSEEIRISNLHPKADSHAKADSLSKVDFNNKVDLINHSLDHISKKVASHAHEQRQPVARQQISEAALREITRREAINRSQISRSLAGFTDEEHRDTALADKWDCCSYNSLFVLPDQSTGTTTEYEEDYEEDLLPYFTETLLLQEDELEDPFYLSDGKAPPSSITESESANRTDDSEQLSSNQSIHNSSQASPEKINPQPSPAPKMVPTPRSKAAKADSTGSAASGPTDSSTALQPYKNLSDNALKLIAQKPETPAATLKWLASHTNPHIRAAVAKNPSTPGDTITVLAKDHEAGIRHSIAENPLSSMDALNLLIKDRNPLIAWRAQNTVSQIRENQRAAQQTKEAALLESQKEKEVAHQIKEAKIATTEETIAFLQVIARKTNTPVRRLEELARHADPRVRGAVAENANAPAEILWQLSKDPESLVKTKVTDNYNCPIEILEAMKDDEDAYVAYQAHSVLNRVLGATYDHHIRTATWP